MHAPKNNLFAYLCATAVGLLLIYLGIVGTLSELLANLILIIVGAMFTVGGVVTIIRHIQKKRAGTQTEEKR